MLVGDGHIGGRFSESRVLLLNPQDLSEKAKTSIAEDLPWSSSTAVLGRDQRHVLVFNGATAAVETRGSDVLETCSGVYFRAFA